MNKEVNFSRFVGIAVVVICIFIVVLALMSAILQNENNDNIVYVDEGTGTTLTIPKSNVVAEYVNIRKEMEIQNKSVNLSVRLPKINIETDTTENINKEIYSIYQNVYSEISNSANIKEVTIDYTYDYLYNDTVLEIAITKMVVMDDGKEDETVSKYTYDIQNDVKK